MERRLRKICSSIKPCASTDPQRDVLTPVASLPHPHPTPPAFPGKQQHLPKGKDTSGDEISWFLMGHEKALTAKSSFSEKSLTTQNHAKGWLRMPCSGAAPTGSPEPTAEPSLVWEDPA